MRTSAPRQLAYLKCIVLKKKNHYLRLIIDIKTDLAKKWTGKGGNYSFVCLFIKVRWGTTSSLRSYRCSHFEALISLRTHMVAL